MKVFKSILQDPKASFIGISLLLLVAVLGTENLWHLEKQSSSLSRPDTWNMVWGTWSFGAWVAGAAMGLWYIQNMQQSQYPYPMDFSSFKKESQFELRDFRALNEGYQQEIQHFKRALGLEEASEQQTKTSEQKAQGEEKENKALPQEKKVERVEKVETAETEMEAKPIGTILPHFFNHAVLEDAEKEDIKAKLALAKKRRQAA